MRVMTQHAHYSQLPRHLVPQSPPSLTASPTFPLWSWQVTTSPLQSIRTSPPVFSPPHRRACTARGSGEVGAGGAAVGQPGRQGGCNVSLFSRTPGAVIYYRVFDTAAGSAAACNTSHTDYSRYPGGGGIYLPQPHQSVSAYAANSPRMVDSFEVFWPGSDVLGDREAEAVSLTRLTTQVFALSAPHMSWRTCLLFLGVCARASALTV